MTKQDQIMEYIIQDVVEYIVADFQVDYDEAMSLFYNSDVFAKLLDTETGLYLESSAYIYDLFCDERTFGRIVQHEL